MSSNPLRRIGEQMESAASGSVGATAHCLNEILGLTRAQAQPQDAPHQFSFDQTLAQQLRTSGFSNASFLARAWQEYEGQYRRTHQNNAPSFQTVRTQFLAPFVTAVTELVFPAGERNTAQCGEFRELLGRWALCQPMFQNSVMSECNQTQRQLLLRYDWLHLSARQRTLLLENVPALRQLGQNAEIMQRMLNLPSCPAESTTRLQQLIPRRMEGQQPPAANAADAIEDGHTRRGIAAYLHNIRNEANHAARRNHLTALLNRAPADRSAGDRIELTVSSLLPYCQNPNAEATYRNMLTYAVYRHLQQHHPQILTINNPTEAMLAPIRNQLAVHSDNAAFRDAVVNVLNDALALSRSGQLNAHMTAYVTALQLRNSPGLQR